MRPHRFVAGLVSGEFFQDTLQVLPCTLLASLPAGDGPERTPHSLPRVTVPQQLAFVTSWSCWDLRLPLRRVRQG